MRVLVTGGFGYLGGRLAQALVARGHDVALGSRLRRSSPAWLPNATVVITDWSAPESLAAACEGTDAVAHLAAMNAQQCVADPAAALQINGVGTAALVRAASGTSKRFLYLSTGHVYASPLQGTINEATCPTALHPYATSHLAGENAVRWATARGEVEGVVARLSNAFGAPVTPDADCWMLLLNDLARQAVQTGRMVIVSNGMQRRDFVAMTEACRSLIHLLELPQTRLEDGVFNIGGGWTPTVLAAAERLAEHLEVRLGMRPVIHRQDSVEVPVLPLVYERTKLLATAFAPSAPQTEDAEFSRLVNFCVEHFRASA